MLSIKTHTSPIAAVLPTAAVQAPAPETNLGQPSFAKMLHDNQAPAPAAPMAAHEPTRRTQAEKPLAEAKAPAPPQAQSAPAHAPPAAAAARPAQPAQPSREATPARETARSPAKSGQAQDDTAAPNAVDAKAEVNDKDKGDTSVAADPALADWLAGLNLPGPSAAAVPLPTTAAAASPGTPAPPTDATAATAAQLTAAATATAAAGNAASVAAGAGVLAGSATPATTAASGRSDTNGLPRNAEAGTRGAARDGSETSLLALATRADASSGQPGAGSGSGDTGSRDGSAPAPVWSPITSMAPAASTPTAFLLAAVNNLTSQTGTQPPQPLAVSLTTPLYSPEFPQAMGAQLTVLAQGGVEHAELHLNPADMGPVSVQIAIEGTQARIDFGADVASTRQAIEASLPELASALRDAGLTLSGGGVSQHSRSRQDMADAQGTSAGRSIVSSHGDGATSIDNAAPAPLRRNVRIGGVDAYA